MRIIFRGGDCWRLTRLALFKIHDSSSLQPGGVRVLIPSARTAFHAEIESHVLDLGSKLVFCSAQSLLKATQQFVLLAFGKR